jgi:hypothetical protein
MDISALQAKVPNICEWIDATLQRHRHSARPVTSFGFARLRQYFQSQTLSRASVVVLDSLPKPPLTKLGLHQFADFEQMDADGITYKNVYFVKRGRAMDESLHFHELVHVIQWQLLGPEQFTLAYAQGLAQGDYASNPFEKIAHALEGRFYRQKDFFSVEPLVEDHARRAARTLLNPSS